VPEERHPEIDPLEELSAQSRATLMGFLGQCGVDIMEFEGVSDGDVSIAGLNSIMGRIWTMHARACALEEEIKRKIELIKQEMESLFARAYSEASIALPKGTETAKKNWIRENKPGLRNLEDRIIASEYLNGMAKAARKALETRSSMLQSINKLKVSELDRLHVHIPDS